MKHSKKVRVPPVSCILGFLSFLSFFLGFPSRLGAAPASHSSSSHSHSSKKTLSYRIRGELQTLDWNRAKSYIEGSVLLNLMEGLVAINPQLEVVPALAKTWSLSSDQKTYTFQLKEKIFWSDGVALHSQHFVESWKRLLSPVTAAPYAYYLFDIVGAKDFASGKISDFSQVGVKAINPWTLEVRLTEPHAYWIQIMAFWSTFPIRKDLIDQSETTWTSPGKLVTLGPFQLFAHDENTRYILSKNPYYSQPRGNLDEVIALIVEDDTEAITLYQHGYLNFLHDLSVVRDQNLKNKPGWHSFQRLKTLFMGFVTTQQPTDNVELRKAIALAIDKEKLCRALSEDHKPASSFVAPPISGYSKEMGYPYHPALAKTTLQKTALARSGWNFHLSYLLPDWEKAKTLATQIKSDLLQNLNITVDVQYLENKKYRSQLELYSSHLYDFSWTADYPDASSFLGIYLSSSGNGGSPWKSSFFDETFLKLLQLPAGKQQQAAAIQLQKHLLEDQVVQVPLCYEPNFALIHPSVQNYEVNALDFFYFKKVTLP